MAPTKSQAGLPGAFAQTRAGERSGKKSIPRWRIGLVTLAGIVLLVIWLPLRTPGWYAPPRIPETQRQIIRDDLTRMSDRFSEALLGTQPFAIELTQAQVNNWLTMRGEMWPAAAEALPAPWSEPFIQFRPGGITLAARCDAVPSRPIVAMTVDVKWQGDEIAVQATGVDCGSMPVPLSFVGRWINSEIDVEDESAGVRARGNLVDGLRLNTRHTWWNGRREYRIVDLQLHDGLLRLEIEPLGPRTRR